MNTTIAEGTVKEPVTITRAALVREAVLLRSAHGENPEYDRALCELVYWAVGGDSYESVREEILSVGVR